MYVAINRKSLKEAMKGIGIVVKPNKHNPILGFMEIDATGTVVRLRGTNLDREENAIIHESQIESTGRVLVPFKWFKKIINAEPSDILDIRSENENEVRILSMDAIYKLKTFPVADFPPARVLA